MSPLAVPLCVWLGGGIDSERVYVSPLPRQRILKPGDQAALARIAFIMSTAASNLWIIPLSFWPTGLDHRCVLWYLQIKHTLKCINCRIFPAWQSQYLPFSFDLWERLQEMNANMITKLSVSTTSPCYQTQTLAPTWATIFYSSLDWQKLQKCVGLYLCKSGLVLFGAPPPNWESCSAACKPHDYKTN